MKNTFNKITQSIFEAFKGPRTKDFEFEKMAQEYQICKERMLNLKNLIDSYPSQLEGFQVSLNSLIENFENIFSKEQEGYFQFMSNVTAAHKALNNKLLAMHLKLEKLQSSMAKWTEHCTSVDGKLALKEEKRKTFDHYDEKMAEMLEDRYKTIIKGKTPSEKDDEKYARNIKKYQNAANEYVEATNDAFKHICYFLDSRYENISLSVLEFIEIKGWFFNEACYIFNFFRNARNNLKVLKQNFRPTHREYDASNFIRGKNLLNVNVEEIMKNSTCISGIIEGKPKSSNNNNDMSRANTFNQNNQNISMNSNNFTNQQRSNTMLNPYGNGNNFKNNNNFNGNQSYAKNPYNNNNNKIDNSIPDPFANEPINNGNFNPYENNDNNMNNNTPPPSSINPYNQGNNNLGDNPFDHPNI